MQRGLHGAEAQRGLLGAQAQHAGRTLAGLDRPDAGQQVLDPRAYGVDTRHADVALLVALHCHFCNRTGAGLQQQLLLPSKLGGKRVRANNEFAVDGRLCSCSSSNSGWIAR